MEVRGSSIEAVASFADKLRRPREISDTSPVERLNVSAIELLASAYPATMKNKATAAKETGAKFSVLLFPILFVISVLASLWALCRFGRAMDAA